MNRDLETIAFLETRKADALELVSAIDTVLELLRKVPGKVDPKPVATAPAPQPPLAACNPAQNIPKPAPAAAIDVESLPKRSTGLRSTLRSIIAAGSGDFTAHEIAAATGETLARVVSTINNMLTSKEIRRSNTTTPARYRASPAGEPQPAEAAKAPVPDPPAAPIVEPKPPKQRRIAKADTEGSASFEAMQVQFEQERQAREADPPPATRETRPRGKRHSWDDPEGAQPINGMRIGASEGSGSRADHLAAIRERKTSEE